MPAQFTLRDHPALDGPMGTLFNSLQERVLLLDPLLSMSIFKGYIAFVRSGHFVDVLPRKRFLRVLLNMPFYAVQGPDGRCVDITGAFGPFEVEYRFSSEQDLSYCMSLVTQAYERDCA